MKAGTTIIVLMGLLLFQHMGAQERRCPVDELMSRGRIAAAGRKAVTSSPFGEINETIQVKPGAGSRWISEDYDFTLYLLDKDLKKDAMTLMCSDIFVPSDTLSFLRGWTFYSTRHLSKACEFFGAVQEGSAFYDQSLFFSVASKAHIHDFEGGLETLTAYTGPYSDLKYLQKAGLDLLMRDFSGYHSDAALIRDSHYAIAEARNDLALTAQMMEAFKPKSMALGGLASALVPGLGKVYAGRTGEGVMAFLTVGAFGAMTAENWKKCGPSDWKTIVFGTLGTICYISNICGSCAAVRIYNENTMLGYETSVLLDIHIPLHSIFR